MLNSQWMSKFSLASGWNVAKAIYSRERGISPSNQEDHQARFYESYRKVAEEYDKEFLKKYDEDLNTTLIFVSFT